MIQMVFEITTENLNKECALKLSKEELIDSA